jgi:hypothetical protein
MPKCVRCQTDTELFENGVPVCLKCAQEETQPKRKPPSTEISHDPRLRDTLFRDLVNATARMNGEQQKFDAMMDEFPTMRAATLIKKAGANLEAARRELTRAHNRLNDFLSRGIIPDDLRRAVGQ